MNHQWNNQEELSQLEGKPRVLYLDDDESNLVAFRANFRSMYEVFIASSPIEAYSLIDECAIQIVITDHQMPSMDGVDFLASIARDFPHVQRLLLTGFSETVPLVDAINKGKVAAVLAKPFEMTEITQIVQDAWENFKATLEKDVLIKQLRRQNQQFEFMLRQRLLS